METKWTKWYAMTSHVIAYQSLELLFRMHTFHFNCFFEDFNCVFTQIRCLSRVLELQIVHGFIWMVNNLHVPHDKKNRYNCTQFAATISLDEKFKDQSRALHSPSFAIYTINALKGKLMFLDDFFSASIYRTEKTLITFPFQSWRALFMKFPTRAYG